MNEIQFQWDISKQLIMDGVSSGLEPCGSADSADFSNLKVPNAIVVYFLWLAKVWLKLWFSTFILHFCPQLKLSFLCPQLLRGFVVSRQAGRKYTLCKKDGSLVFQFLHCCCQLVHDGISGKIRSSNQKRILDRQDLNCAWIYQLLKSWLGEIVTVNCGGFLSTGMNGITQVEKLGSEMEILVIYSCSNKYGISHLNKSEIM